MHRASRLALAMLCLLGLPGLGPCCDVQSELRRAHRLEAAREYPQSMAVYRTVLQADPDNLDATLGLGRAHFLALQYPEAAQRFERALELSPYNEGVLDWLARSYLGSGEPQRAINLLQSQRATVGQSAWAHLLLGHAYESLDKLDDARIELNRALTLNPNCRGAHFALGFIAWTGRDLNAAKAELTKELKLPSYEYLAFYYLAETLELEGKLDQAGLVLKKMGGEAPDTYAHHFALGKWNELKGNFGAAAEEFELAIQIDSQQIEAHYHLAANLRKLGRVSRAEQELNRVYSLRTETHPGTAQGMGKMRPHLPLPGPPFPPDR
jgi:tetratricopeptide (TPR) repeat protein